MIVSDLSVYDRELISARVFPASIESVFKAWSDPALLAKWWGPHGFTNTIHEFNFKPRGAWSFTMHGPDGRHYENKIIFSEILPGKKVVFEHVTEPYFKVLASFDHLGAKTKLTFRMMFKSPEKCEAIKTYAIEANEQNFDRLAALLNGTANLYVPNPELDLVLERIVELPPNLLWKVWTEPEHLKQWFCPLPWTVANCKIDLWPGGKFMTVMRSPEGHEFPTEGCFLEVIENSKLIWTDTLLGGYRPSEKPFMTAMVRLEPHAHGTKYTAIAIHKNSEERMKHEKMGFKEGWSICLDQLVRHMRLKR